MIVQTRGRHHCSVAAEYDFSPQITRFDAIRFRLTKSIPYRDPIPCGYQLLALRIERNIWRYPSSVVNNLLQLIAARRINNPYRFVRTRHDQRFTIWTIHQEGCTFDLELMQKVSGRSIPNFDVPLCRARRKGRA